MVQGKLVKLLTAMAACAMSGASAAQERISPDEFLDVAVGKTLTFNAFPGGYVVGREEFLRRDLSVWRFEGGACVYGTVSIREDLLCFQYDDDPDGLPTCWGLFIESGTFYAMSVESAGMQEVTAISDTTLDCPILPGV